jgi:ribonucleoside-diphosphate reductase alpha chain
VQRYFVRRLPETVKGKDYSHFSEVKGGWVKSVREASAEEVFDIYLEPEKSFWCEGLISRDCSEIPLLPNESCNLGSIDVSKFVDKKAKTFQWEQLGTIVETAVRFLDDVITVNVYPYVKIRTATLRTRKIGLGIMGWADALIALGVRYGSEESFNLADSLMSFLWERANGASKSLGEEKGVYLGFRRNNGREARRNATLLAIAPTGSISILADCSSGLEPLYGLEYTKTILNSKKLHFCNKYLDVDPSVLVTAHEIAPADHVRMQAVFQKHVDNAVSKTVNLPQSATEKDVKEIILLAHELGCKSISVFREGSRPGAPLSKENCAFEVCML